jgi:16S rRNA (adenine1518-N6/adenine1519-N6)-dimethyltransferase
MAARPKLGQNFLHDAQAAERIVAALGDCSARTVIEIGPGRGAVTRVLAARARHVIAVELDGDLADGLGAQFPPDRVTIVHQDVLGFDMSAAAQRAGERLLVIGNLPYYITSPILLKLAASHAASDRAVLMMQREVADRVAAGPGSRDYGLLSVTAQVYGYIEKLFTLGPASFSPPPRVHSTVIRWQLAPRFLELGIEEASFIGFLRKAFAHKRKTLVNNLKSAGFRPALIARAFDRSAIDPQARAESLSVANLALLCRNLPN